MRYANASARATDIKNEQGNNRPTIIDVYPGKPWHKPDKRRASQFLVRRRDGRIGQMVLLFFDIMEKSGARV